MINDNAYKVDLPGEYGVSATFNVVDLSPIDIGYEEPNSMMNSFERGGRDEDQGSPIDEDQPKAQQCTPRAWRPNDKSKDKEGLRSIGQGSQLLSISSFEPGCQLIPEPKAKSGFSKKEKAQSRRRVQNTLVDPIGRRSQ